MSQAILEALKDGLSESREAAEVAGYRKAAVLVPLLVGAHGLELLFTVRSQTLTNHAGQIAFPGGALEDGESVGEAARRETFEEIGLDVPETALLGCLNDLFSPARYVATPVVAALGWPKSLCLNPVEVEEAFTVPLRELWELQPRSEVREHMGIRRRIYFYPWRERLIWGFTGNILRNLLEVLEVSLTDCSRTS
ncbi:MAG: CoA pyrophosphatase [Trueperaceae bacterium]|nr:MAG: CoA pyrophosphatase [Trueperaceae bacterium]